MRSPDRLVRAGLRRLARPFAAVARHFAGSIRAVQTSQRVAAITFDDGPSPSITPQVLEILKHHNARATFFMIGEAAAAAPHLVQRAAEHGHVIGNHTWSHYSLPLLAHAERVRQIRAAAAALEPFARKLFRPPYGHQNWSCRWATWRMGYEVIAFSVHAEDWLPHEPDWMANRLINGIRPGSIVILHDQIYRNVLPRGHHDRSQMLHALDQMLTRLKHEYSFVTVPDLLRCGPAVRINWYEKSPPELEPALRSQLLPAR